MSHITLIENLLWVPVLDHDYEV